MNIREIEQQLGIPRANVRYYEKEGLLHPQRSANVSEQPAATAMQNITARSSVQIFLSFIMTPFRVSSVDAYSAPHGQRYVFSYPPHSPKSH